ncbi:hypothetical protein BuS5_00733 [Desulfosarcina sp. BuS5]|uniref:hypothetical protein n=1 Tax=Desulfosarcina sp. BuS5 TaxID=933262 RepID=UPI000484DC77|nr:hypothetical protein [Desulfosarcina sp. BuS5]WDN87765.1 hypothetical protein BuS5_00733 [Desulfosarcina sp. BuS5]
MAKNENGWHIKASTRFLFDPDNATILVRIIEAASIKFTDGGGVPVIDGDIVKGQTSGAKGRVVGSPILNDDDAGSWASNNAAGIILLNNVIGTFTSDEIIDVNRPVITATVKTKEIDAYSKRDNYIRAYYGTAENVGSPSSDPLDDQQMATSRGTIFWPPDNTEEWSAAVDYFTLVAWDANDNLNLPGEEQLDSNTMIRSGSLTTSATKFAKPEIGLHTFGINSTSIYFDDFAMQAVIQADPIIPPPVQE